MNIKVHTSAVLATCTLAGLLLGGILVERHRQVDRSLTDLDSRSVSVRNVKHLRSSIGEWLTLNDLVMRSDSGQSYMVKASVDQSKRLRILIAELRHSSVARALDPSFSALLLDIERVENLVFEARDSTGTDREARLEAILDRSKPVADQLVRRVWKIEDHLDLHAEHLRRDLLEEESVLTVLSWLAGLFYFGIVFLCWLWTVHRVVLPIGSLSEAAARADHEDREFALPETGPEEVRQLTHNISSFVSKLQQAKAGTEEEVRQRTIELVKANQAKGDFLATMSHELRTPLNGIINMNELILETELTQDQNDYARTAKGAAEALLGLINDILDFSKIDAKKLELEEAAFDLRAVMDSAVEILAGVAKSKGLDLQATVEADVPPQLVGDPTRLRQVLINLLNNALKFTESGSVMVHAGVEAAQSGRYRLELQVTDTGIGIPEDSRSTLFSAFKQVDSSTTRKYGGTGLGLAICRELVTLMHGRIDVDSVVGEGSTFWFTAEFGAVEGATIDSVDLGERRIALVSQRPAMVERTVQQLIFLGVPAPSIDVVDGVDELPNANANILALVDPYGRGEDAFGQVDAARDHPAIDSERIAVLDNWLRHWPSEMGSPSGSFVRIGDPTALDALRQWIRGESASQSESPAAAKARAPESIEDDPHTTPTASEAITGRRVLIAEDTAINHRVIRSILERDGFHVEVVENGQEALDAFAARPFDIIVMDCQMPVLDGLEATRNIRALELERTPSSRLADHVPIIALTANTAPDFDRECFAAGMDRFLSKPCRKTSLLAAIEDCFEARARQRPSPERLSPRVLVADDDAINRKVAQTILGRAGYTVTVVTNGQEAVDALRTSAFEIVLMDWQMPVLDGLSATRQIRELGANGGLAPEACAELPIVAMTGNSLDSDRVAAAEAGMSDFVTKPFRPKDLIQVVTRLAGPGRNG